MKSINKYKPVPLNLDFVKLQNQHNKFNITMNELRKRERKLDNINFVTAIKPGFTSSVWFLFVILALITSLLWVVSYSWSLCDSHVCLVGAGVFAGLALLLTCGVVVAFVIVLVLKFLGLL